MASINHTAPARPLVCNESNSLSTASLDGPFHSQGNEQERQRTNESHYSRTAFAVVVIEGILKTHHDYQQAQQTGESRRLLPLNTAQRIGLETAIDLLHHYVDTLSPETSG